MKADLRFWSFVEFALDGSGCLVWTGSRNQLGYGLFRADGRTISAHRWAYIERNGRVPEGLVLDHLCRNPSCVNPDHLEAVTQRENVVRGLAPAAENARKDRCIRGHRLIVIGGRRHCPTCARASKRQYKARKKAAA